MFHLNQKGEGRSGAIFGLLLLAFGIYIAWKFVPVMIKVYDYEDSVKEACKMSRGNLPKLEEKIVMLAEEKEVPVDYEDVEVSLGGDERLRAKVHYVVPITFIGGYTYDWKADIEYEAPLF